MKNVDISPVLHEDLPSGVGDSTHEESIQDEDGVHQSLDIRKILGEPEQVDVDLEAQNSVKSPVEALGKELREGESVYQSICSDVRLKQWK